MFLIVSKEWINAQLARKYVKQKPNHPLKMVMKSKDNEIAIVY
jgi:hypothetical protein